MIDFKSHLINCHCTVKQALEKINNFSTSMTLFIINDSNQMIGSLTDGDIRRGLLKGVQLSDNIEKIMFKNFQYLTGNAFSVYDIKSMKEKLIHLVPVLDKNKEIIQVFDFERLK